MAGVGMTCYCSPCDLTDTTESDVASINTPGLDNSENPDSALGLLCHDPSRKGRGYLVTAKEAVEI